MPCYYFGGGSGGVGGGGGGGAGALAVAHFFLEHTYNSTSMIDIIAVYAMMVMKIDTPTATDQS